jgi:hypothetical protein
MKATALTFSKQSTFSVLFSDGIGKNFDFSESIGFGGVAGELKDYSVFSSGVLSENGRRIEWKKEDEVFFDLCVDALRYFWKDADNEWAGIDPETSLSERILITEKKLKSA